MTDAISSKLLTVLAVAVLVAGFGAWKLLGGEGATGDVGFGQTDELPIFVPEDADEVTPITEPIQSGSRNPFERVGPGPELSPTPAEDSTTGDDPEEEVEADSTEPAPVPSIPEPVFPDPGLVDQEPPGADRGDPRDDTSFEG